MPKNTAQETYKDFIELRVSDVADILGVSTGTVRNYEKSGLISSERAKNGYRIFDIRDVVKLRNQLTKKKTPNKFTQSKNKLLKNIKTHSKLSVESPKKLTPIVPKKTAIFSGTLTALFVAMLFVASPLGNNRQSSLKTSKKTSKNATSATIPRKSLSSGDNKNVLGAQAEVLAEHDSVPEYVFSVMVPSFFRNTAEFEQATQLNNTLTVNDLSSLLGGLTTPTINGVTTINDTTKLTFEETLEVTGNNISGTLTDVAIENLNEDNLADTIEYAGDFDFAGTWAIDGTEVTATADQINNISSTSSDAVELDYLDGATVTAGGVVFGNGSIFTQDAPNFFWNDTTNRLGIGTNSPTETLDITGRISLSQTTAPSTVTNKLYNVSGDLIWNGVNLSAGGALPNGITGQTLYNSGGAWAATSNLYSDNTNVGIGTSNPSAKLEIAGSSDTEQFIIKANSTQSNTNPLIQLQDSSGTALLSINSDNRYNTFVGLNAGRVNNISGTGSDGLFNTFLGGDSGYANTIGSDNTASGAFALYANTTGSYNVAIGRAALIANDTGSNNVAIGNSAGTFILQSIHPINNNVIIGSMAGILLDTGADNNILIGYAAGNNISTGANNLILGYNIDAPSATGSNQLSIGNLIFGTGIDGTGTSISSGNIGIGTNTPLSKLGIVGNTAIGSTYGAFAAPTDGLIVEGNVGIGTTNPSARLDIVGGGLRTKAINLTSGNILSGNTGFNKYIGSLGGFGTGGQDSILQAKRLSNTGNLVNIGSIQAGETLLSYGGTLTAKVDYSVGASPNTIEAADIDGDGISDIVTSNQNDNSVSVLINNGDGTFASKVDYTTGAKTYSVNFGDFNGDGMADLATANGNDDTTSVLMNNGEGTFASKVDYATGNTPEDISIGDFNGDGMADLATVNSADNSMSILFNNGDGTFASKVDYTTGSVPRAIGLGDFNGDGMADLATVNYSSNTMSIFINNGDGTFASKVDYTASTGPWDIATGDLDNDGKIDIATANANAITASVFINNGDGTFASKVDYATRNLPVGVDIGDLTGDGVADLVTANYVSYTTSVFVNNGDGTFASKVDYTAGTWAYAVAIADLNKDGLSDLSVVNAASNNVSVFINNINTLFFADASSGYVGIGTTNPSSKLDIVGTATTVPPSGSKSLLIQNATTDTSQSVYGFISDLELNTASNSGQIYYGGYSNSGTASGNANDFTGRVVGFQGQVDHYGTGTITQSRGTAGSVVNRDSGTLTNAYGGYFGVYNFGSGTIDNGHSLYIVDGSNSGTVTSKTGITIPNIANATNTTDLLIGTTTIPAGDFSIYNANTASSYYAGNIGIGTTNPSLALDITGNARFSSVGSGTYSADLNLTSDGTLTTASSDESLKTNLTEIDSALEKILKLQGYYFNWKENPKGPKDIGLIAQDVEKVVPEVTFTNKTDGLMGVNYSRITALLIEGIKEQQKQIDRLTDENVLGIQTQSAKQSTVSQNRTDSITDIQELFTRIKDFVASLGMTVTTSDNESAEDLLSFANDVNFTKNVIMNDLTVTGDLNAGLIKLDSLNNSISILGASCFSNVSETVNSQLCENQALKLQNKLAGNVDIFDGKIIFSPDGSLLIEKVIAEKVEVKNLEIKEKIAGSNSIRGAEILNSGDESIEISKNWDESPISITLTPSYNSNVWVTDLSKDGFKINVSVSSNKYETIYWVALW